MDTSSSLLLSSSPKRSLDISDQPPVVENKNDNNGNMTATKMTESRTGKKSGSWVAYRDDDGRYYYYHAETGETQWDQPGGSGMVDDDGHDIARDNASSSRGGRGGDGSTDIIQTPLADAMDDERSNVVASGGRGCAFALAGTMMVGMATVMAIVKVQPLVSNYTNSKSMGKDILCSFFIQVLFRPNYFIISLYSSNTFTVPTRPH